MALRGYISAYTINNSISVSATTGWTGSSPQSGDIILAVLSSGGGTSNTITPPSGFNTNGSLPNYGNTYDGSTAAFFYKVAATESGSYTFGISANDAQTLHMRCYSGRNTSSPFSAVQATSESAQVTPMFTYAITGLTAVAGDDVVVLIPQSSEYVGATLTYTPPSGFANSVCIWSGANYGRIVCACDYVNHPSGATGTIQGTFADNASNNQVYAAYVLSLAQGAASCTHSGEKSDGTIAVPDGSTGLYRGKIGTFVTPDCSTIQYKQPTVGNFGTAQLLPLAPLGWIIRRRITMAKKRK